MNGKKDLVKNTGEFLLELVFPKKCPVCGEILEESKKHICTECEKLLIFTEDVVCCKCGRPLVEEEKEYCNECSYNERYKKLYFEKNHALIEHNEAASKILYDFKYKNYRENINYLSAEFFKKNPDLINTWKAEIFIPVPLHKKRYIKRGFNQAQIIAEKLSKYYGIRVENCFLERINETVPQKELNKIDRKKNVENSFKISNNIVKYKKVILIDDIYTTGSTLNECARILKESGVQQIYCITMSIVT